MATDLNLLFAKTNIYTHLASGRCQDTLSWSLLQLICPEKINVEEGMVWSVSYRRGTAGELMSTARVSWLIKLSS